MPISSASANGSGGIAATGGGAPEQSASCIVAKAAAGSHTLTIDGYSLIKEAIAGRKSITSAFIVGGHTWHTQFIRSTAGWTYMLLRLRCACTHCIDDGEKVSASYTFSLLGHDEQPSYSESSGGRVYTFTNSAFSTAYTILAESQTATYLRGDRFKVRCDVTVYKGLRCEDRDVPSRLVAVPPPDMGDHLGRLLSSGVGADLTLVVAGETFAAHRYILAVRSPVLLQEIVSAAGLITKTESEAAATATTASCGIQQQVVCGMEAGVFKALLHYIYTDSLPEIDEGETTMDMPRHLIAAADRYSLERLKLMCEDMLCRRVDTSTVAAILAIAEEYNCHGLKKACLQFLMSGSNLKAAMEAGGFEHLRSSCPSVLKELLAMVDHR